MLRILLHPYVLIGLLILGVLLYNGLKYSKLRKKMAQLHPQQKMSILMQALRVLGLLFFRRF
jgi:hypothetical protein